MVVSEVRLLQSFRHPHIVAYYGCIVEPGPQVVLLIMEHCAGGDLETKIKKVKAHGGAIGEELGTKVATQLCLALQAMASHDGGNAVIHRDIKPSNILLDEHENVKIADLGLACVHGGDRHKVKKQVGTPFYMAPEMMKEYKTSPGTDLWAVGCVLYEMAMLKRAFEAKGKEDLEHKVMTAPLPRVGGKWGTALRKLVGDMLVRDPALRPGVAALLRSEPVCGLIQSEAVAAEEPLSSPTCLLYTSDAADEEDSVDLGGRRIIKKKKKKHEERQRVMKSS
eukprot:TRINITY_DN24592_c0_g1_i2.p1 TRINITY_DN24592_c0_g1~~TRINITY_DN24592_c0_g1_i2.p1  ORF type:complete len:280 (+),score=78.58 TRINITY_DN24592_c0_g1_i2:188-1027(+)